MNIELYSTNDNRNKIKKTLTTLTTISDYSAKTETSVSTPSIIMGSITKEILKTIMQKSNYCYIEEFGRYYFIENITMLTGSRLQIDCTVDVLYTFKDSILPTKQVISRQENKKNYYLADSQLPVHSDKSITVVPFGETLGTNTNCCIVLQTTGSGGGL